MPRDIVLQSNGFHPNMERVTLTPDEFNALLDYSCSLPTGTTIGKTWKRRVDYHDPSQGWLLGEYVESDKPDMVGIKWKRILVLE